MNKMFEFATRNKLRFPFKGCISVEDLWDLSLANLDEVFKALNARVKKVNEESLLSSKSKEDEVLEVQIEIVKYIFQIKKEEADTKVLEREKKEKLQKLLKIKEQKQNQALMDMSLDDLDKEISKLL